MALRSLIAVIALLAGAAQADPPPMAAAGVLERDGRTDCSAVLIAPDLIATAAHCVAGRNLPAQGGDFRILFRTGAYPGHPASDFEVAQIATHPLYIARAAIGARTIEADLALARLARSVPADIATPVPPGAPVDMDATVLLATWPGGAGDRARERRCPVLAAEAAVVTLSCVVVPGESGGGVIRLTPGGPELAAILVATGKSGRQPFGYAVQARARVAQLKAIHGLGDP